ncbi:relaxase/mobilization nuclease domain-containing protein [Flavobacterium sp. TAB 87]|uniref:relaxase/mobilization nuclease domain-containing protein n=1 Tax=Flavobacterium sp. TAB 87 TaxID=1729581 RepID=UPI00076C0D39|nr:relaxase/mobilization nuclease domain-containing protein [Flavobacterium sp. TAB 87]KVV16228.1 Relaxase/mobilization nuclease domain protein [Flavobacterium sp. TAB 87]
MVAIINTGHSIRAIFNYNEKKVALGIAECIGEGNYPMDIDKMTPTLKLKMLLRQLELNENVTRNSIHISLNFDPSEKELSKEKLIEIAAMYMDTIGFGDQPYLIYQHHDAGHPHIHIVSIKVKSDGQRIDIQNIGRNQSEKARKQIETLFNLVPAERHKSKTELDLIPIPIQKIQYGVVDSKKAISIVLKSVIPNYKYTTIGELNAVLNLYKVSALQGKEGSKMLLNKGLAYQIMDANKKPIGVPIKASSFHFKSTLSYLEKRFESNKKARVSDMKRVRNAIDLAFLQNGRMSLCKLEKELLEKGIAVVSRKSPEGLIYGITYIDHHTKCVFNGSALGVSYSAKAVQARCGITPLLNNKTASNFQETAITSKPNNYKSFISENELQKIIDQILQPEYSQEYVSNQLKGRRKKRKRKGTSDNL